MFGKETEINLENEKDFVNVRITNRGTDEKPDFQLAVSKMINGKFSTEFFPLT
jgi:hypothetical protein